jgi:membrane associated rhomboid family serine protease
LSKTGKKSEDTLPSESPARIDVAVAASPWDKSSNGKTSDDKPTTIEIDAFEEAVQRRIVANRRKLFWPGVWTCFALAGTYGTFAYLDVKFSGGAASYETRPLERIQIPQSWFLTPTVIKEGVIAAWKELDKLTIGIIITTIAVHLMKKSPLPFWERLIHITGEKKYTAFTYPLVHADWGHLASNMLVIIWFLPGVVNYLGDDYFQAAALLLSVPLITSYMQHFFFRFGPLTDIPLNLGSSGVLAAVIGAFCVVYPTEKVWFPGGLVLRLDAKYWSMAWILLQLAFMVKTPTGGNRPAYFVRMSFPSGCYS